MNIRKGIRSALMLFVSAGFVLIIIGIASRVHQRIIEKNRIITLPSFTAVHTDGRSFNTSDLRPRPLLMIFFHPDCKICQYEIQELTQILPNLNGVSVILISHAPVDLIDTFVRNTGLKKFSDLIILIDPDLKIRELFYVNTVPTSFIYNARLNLVKRYEGEVKTETILTKLVADD